MENLVQLHNTLRLFVYSLFSLRFHLREIFNAKFMIKLYLLGATAVKIENDNVDRSFITGSKRLALVTYLLLASPRGYHRRDTLTALFWPEIGQKRARNALSNLIFHIRDALGKEIIQNRGTEEIAINNELLWCDALACRTACENGHYRKALDHYRGDLLQGLHVKNTSNDLQDWLDRERETFRKCASEAAIRLAEEMEQSGDKRYTRELVEKAVELMPLSHQIQQRAIELLVRTDATGDALMLYARYAERLDTELGVPVDNDLQQLVTSLKKKHSEQLRLSTSKKEFHRPVTVPGPFGSTNKNSDSKSRDLPRTTILQLKTWIPRFALITLVIAVVVSIWLYSPEPAQTDMTAPENAVAVLPFTHINDPDSSDYFSIGLTDEILTNLARAGDLSVISRTSVMQFTNSSKTVREIASELGVSSIVEGSVMTAGDDVRITVKLINAETDRNMWAESYDGKIENILSVQNEVATQVAHALQAELLPEHQLSSPGRVDINEKAYHLYLRGKHLLDLNEPEGVIEAASYFEQSVAIDSTFAPAYSNLALARLRSGLLSRFDVTVTGVEGLPLQEASQLASRAADRALSLDSSMVNAHLVQALIAELVDKKWHQSEVALQKALELAPNNSEMLQAYGWHLLRVGNIERALPLLQKAVRLDPLAWATHHSLGYAYYCMRNFKDAIQQLETSVTLGSRYPNTKKYLSTARLKYSQHLFEEGRTDEGRMLIEEASSMLNEMWGTETGWKETIIFAAMQDVEKTRVSLDNYALPYPPRIYATLLIGDREEALQLISRNLNFHHRVYMDPIFDTVRHHPRFKDLVEQKLNRRVTIE